MSTFSFETFSESVRRAVRTRTLGRNEPLFLEGNGVESIYFVEAGCVRLVVHPDDGKQLVLYRARAGEAFAEEHLSLDTFSYSAFADEACTIQSVSKTALLSDIQSNPEIAKRFIGCMSRRYYQLRINFERLGIKSASKRVLHLLQSMQKGDSRFVDLSRKVKSVSSDLNLTHEATYRALRDLEKEGAIRREGGRIEILKDQDIL